VNQEMRGLGEYKLRLFLFLFFFLKYSFLCSFSIPLLSSFSPNPLPNSCNLILLSELLYVLLTIGIRVNPQNFSPPQL
jgi:hypothetical protein